MSTLFLIFFQNFVLLIFSRKICSFLLIALSVLLISINLSLLQSSSYVRLLSAFTDFFHPVNFFFSAIKQSASALSIWTDEKISFKRRTQSKTNHKSNYLRNPLMHYTLSHCYVFFLWAGSFSKPKKLGLQPAESASRRVFRMLGKKVQVRDLCPWPALFIAII